MKTVVTSAMVAHLFAQRAQERARNSSNSFYFEGPILFSYGSHFPVAVFCDERVKVEDGRALVLANDESRSNSTARHQRHAWQAFRGRTDVRVIDVPSLAYRNNAADTVAANVVSDSGTSVEDLARELVRAARAILRTVAAEEDRALTRRLPENALHNMMRAWDRAEDAALLFDAAAELLPSRSKARRAVLDEFAAAMAARYVKPADLERLRTWYQASADSGARAERYREMEAYVNHATGERKTAKKTAAAVELVTRARGLEKDARGAENAAAANHRFLAAASAYSKAARKFAGLCMMAERNAARVAVTRCEKGAAKYAPLILAEDLETMARNLDARIDNAKLRHALGVRSIRTWRAEAHAGASYGLRATGRLALPCEPSAWANFDGHSLLAAAALIRAPELVEDTRKENARRILAARATSGRDATARRIRAGLAHLENLGAVIERDMPALCEHVTLERARLRAMLAARALVSRVAILAGNAGRRVRDLEPRTSLDILANNARKEVHEYARLRGLVTLADNFGAVLEHVGALGLPGAFVASLAVAEPLAKISTRRQRWEPLAAAAGLRAENEASVTARVADARAAFERGHLVTAERNSTTIRATLAAQEKGRAAALVALNEWREEDAREVTGEPVGELLTNARAEWAAFAANARAELDASYQRGAAGELAYTAWMSPDVVHAITNADHVSAWRAGDRAASLRYGLPPVFRLAANGCDVESSMGAVVSVRAARRLWALIRATVASGVARAWPEDGPHVGPFVVEWIDTAGGFKAGCHTVRAEDARDFARVMAWPPFGEAGADDVADVANLENAS